MGCSHADSGGPGTYLRTGGDLRREFPDGQVYVLCPRLSPARSRSRDSGGPARSPLTAASGRRPDTLPVLSGETDYAGGLNAEDWRDQLFYKPLIGLGFVLESTGIERPVSPCPIDPPPEGGGGRRPVGEDRKDSAALPPPSASPTPPPLGGGSGRSGCRAGERCLTIRKALQQEPCHAPQAGPFRHGR